MIFDLPMELIDGLGTYCRHKGIELGSVISLKDVCKYMSLDMYDDGESLEDIYFLYTLIDETGGMKSQGQMCPEGVMYQEEVRRTSTFIFKPVDKTLVIVNEVLSSPE